MSAPTYFWHDYESFGVNPRHDRPSQFAGIRTDLELNVVEDAVMEYCKPCLDYVPHPQACLLTGITPQEADARGWPEPEFIRRVLDQLGRPGTCGVGYNSLRFDDELTRHTAWRNFHDPYVREWQNGCSRWDIIDMVRMTYALRPEGIVWPLREDGKPSFKLEHLATANNLEQARAHDALSDVHATIALARLIRERQPRLYDFVVENKDKHSARAMLDLQHHTPVVHISSRFPAEQGCLSLVMPIAMHPTNKNAVLVCDLRHDPQAWLDLPPEDLAELIFTPRADLPEGVERAAIKAVHINKCPVLAPAKTIDAAQAERLALNLEQCRIHYKLLRDHIETVAPTLQIVFGQSEFDEISDPEQNLYGGFVGAQDRRLCNQVLQTTADEFDGFELPFEDPRLHELLFRYRARHHPGSLNEAERDEWARHTSRRLEYAADGGLSLDDYEALLSQVPANAEQDELLAALRAWGQRLRSQL
ncbi:MAG: exodeoxyribonuclease I [Oceanococcus sp.]